MPAGWQTISQGPAGADSIPRQPALFTHTLPVPRPAAAFTCDLAVVEPGLARVCVWHSCLAVGALCSGRQQISGAGAVARRLAEAGWVGSLVGAF